tara:strand:- start:4029 stop:5180 length:1152 start_codon:yes stop_codon:yes gene_type:complete
MFANLCPPALLYLIFSITQIVVDTMKGMYNTAFFKLVISLLFILLLNSLCQNGLGIVSWIIVFIPFIMMTVIVSVLLVIFGLDPASGKLNIYHKNKKIFDSRQELMQQNIQNNTGEVLGTATNLNSKKEKGSFTPTTSDQDRELLYKREESVLRQRQFKFLKDNIQTKIRTVSRKIETLDGDTIEAATKFINNANKCLDKGIEVEMKACFYTAVNNVLLDLTPAQGLAFKASVKDVIVDDDDVSVFKTEKNNLEQSFSEEYHYHIMSESIASTDYSNNDVISAIQSAWNTGVKECKKFFNISNKQKCETQTLCNSLKTKYEGADEVEHSMASTYHHHIASNFKGYVDQIEAENDLGAYQRVVAGDIGLQKNRYKNLSEFTCNN